MVDLINVARNLKTAGAVAGYFSTGTPGESYYYIRLDPEDRDSGFLFMPADMGLIPFVGRATELEFLQWFYKNAGSGMFPKSGMDYNFMKTLFVSTQGKGLPEGYEPSNRGETK